MTDEEFWNKMQDYINSATFAAPETNALGGAPPIYDTSSPEGEAAGNMCEGAEAALRLIKSAVLAALLSKD